MKSLYKLGDIVRLLPWVFFDEHISIPKSYWDDLMDKNLVIFNIDDKNYSSPLLNGKYVSGVYYIFKNHMFSWAEEFLKPTHSNFLKDKDFEI